MGAAAGQTASPAQSQSAAAPKAYAALPPDVAFGRFIALIRGHLITGDALVKERDWDEAEAHFRYPSEEIYGVIREDLPAYKTPHFDDALRTLVRTVAAHNKKRYPKALDAVERPLGAADMELKKRQSSWSRFQLTVAVEVLRTAAEEYGAALGKERFAHPVDYRTARGFILEADRMVEGVSADLAGKNAEALRDLRQAMSELKTVVAAVEAPKRPLLDEAGLRGIVSRIERITVKFM